MNDLPDRPFDLSEFLTEEEAHPPLKLGKVVIPAYGSVTVIEAELIEQLWAGYTSENLKAQEIWTQMATILLKCRYRSDWTIEYSKQLPTAMLQAAFEFFQKEQLRWREPDLKLLEEAQEITAQKKPGRAGKKPSGGFAELIQEKNGSVPEALPDALPT